MLIIFFKHISKLLEKNNLSGPNVHFYQFGLIASKHGAKVLGVASL